MSQNTKMQLDIDSILDILRSTKVSEPEISSITQTIRPTRCCMEGCKKKLMMTDFPCKCEKIHCSLHRASDLHNCKYDYKTVAKENLTKAMPIVIAKKLDMI